MYGFRGTSLLGAVSLLFTPAGAAGQAEEPAETQVRRDSAAAAATDAFGEQVGLNQAGLYSPVQTRGFDLMASSSAFRLDGFYFHPAATPSESLIEGLSVNVGIAATALDLPSPTGVIGYRLRNPGESSSLSVTTGLRQEQSPHVELLGNLVNGDGSIGMVGHALFVADDNRSTGEDGTTFHVGGVSQWKPGPGTRLRLFGSYSRSRYEGDLGVLAVGPGVPPPLPQRRKYGPEWARSSNWSSNSGALLDHHWQRWALGASFVRSRNHASRSDLTLLEIDSAGDAAATLYHTPAVESRSDSGEAKIARTFPLLGIEHSVGVAVRQRTTVTGRASAVTVPLGEFRLGQRPSPVPEPDFAESIERGRDRVEQRIVSATYSLQAGTTLDLRLGAHRNRYEKAVTEFSGAESTNLDQTWLYSASAVLRPLPRLRLFASYVSGLEETGTAPSAASNRGEVLPPVKARQYELGGRFELTTGLSLILAGFDIRKPIYGLRTDGVYAPTGTVRHRGLEGSLTGQLTPTTTVVLGANVVEPSVAGELVEAGLVEDVAPGVSRFNATVSVEQRITRDWSADVFFLHEGSRRRDSGGTAEVRAVPWLILGTRYSQVIGGTEFLLRGEVINAIDRKGWWATPYGPLVAVPPVTYRLMVTAAL